MSVGSPRADVASRSKGSNAQEVEFAKSQACPDSCRSSRVPRRLASRPASPKNVGTPDGGISSQAGYIPRDQRYRYIVIVHIAAAMSRSPVKLDADSDERYSTEPSLAHMVSGFALPLISPGRLQNSSACRSS